ncbi:out at first protein isoform X2 [Daktulosphaira vitifoliae]|uniref:out at first protein isoform X2 n=1 Tax=Daktulosphaira vitifoliae TaxID=58002 RepID=UPI0021AA939F|nr:out at first protein isoform X2 [Daktulosphaira vitifoliae]
MNGIVIKETIKANLSDDSITLELQLPDSTLITQHIDFTKEVQIIQVLLLGEEERGQKPFQIVCFVNHIYPNEFISPDAMAKLRQKNPSTIRTSEEFKGIFNISVDLKIKPRESHDISSHISSFCSEAHDSTFTRKVDIEKWNSLSGSLIKQYEHTDHKVSKPTLKLCRDTVKMWTHCLCTMEVVIPWYPCALKFCKDHPNKKSTTIESYRCGIHTCTKTFNFMYNVKHKLQCLSIE